MHLLSRLIRPAIFLLLVFGLAGCGKPELSRSSAKSLIEGSSELKSLTQKLPLNSQAAAKAHALGILSNKGVLTHKGSQLFSKFGYAEAILVQPVSPPNVDITGIAPVPMAEDMKEVQFDLAFQLPPTIKRFAVSGGKGVAHFRRYDDGWRLEGVKFSMSSEEYTLTQQEVSDQQAEVDAADKLKVDLQKSVEQSRVPKKVIMKFVTGEIIYAYGADQDLKELTLSDTEIYANITPPPILFGAPAPGHLWFGDIKESYGGCSLKKYHVGWRGLESLYQNLYPLTLKMKDGNELSFKFIKVENCHEFKMKFEEALQRWRNTYSEAFKSLAEL